MRITNWKALCGPGVYVCLLDGAPMYVGFGKHLLYRVSSPAHHKRVFEVCDEVLLFPCETLAEAKRLERTLINAMQPSLNELSAHTPAIEITFEEKRALIEKLRS